VSSGTVVQVLNFLNRN